MKDYSGREKGKKEQFETGIGGSVISIGANALAKPLETEAGSPEIAPEINFIKSQQQNHNEAQLKA